MRFSILIPARNEEKCLPGCLESIQAAAAPFPDQVESSSPSTAAPTARRKSPGRMVPRWFMTTAGT